MRIHVPFYSYFKDLTGCAETIEEVPVGATLGQLHEQLMQHFPKLAEMKRSTLIAVGVDYQPRDFCVEGRG